jgi:hypothetical protein
MVGTPEVKTKKQERKTKKALDPGRHKKCECRVRTPLFLEIFRFAVEVEYLVPTHQQKLCQLTAQASAGEKVLMKLACSPYLAGAVCYSINSI